MRFQAVQGRPLAPAGSWLETQRGGMLTVEAHGRRLVQFRPGTMICLVDKCWALAPP